MERIYVTLATVKTVHEIQVCRATEQPIAVDFPDLPATMTFKLDENDSAHDFDYWGNKAFRLKCTRNHIFLVHDEQTTTWYLSCGGPGHCEECLDEFLDNGPSIMLKIDLTEDEAMQLLDELTPHGDIIVKAGPRDAYTD